MSANAIVNARFVEALTSGGDDASAIRTRDGLIEAVGSQEEIIAGLGAEPDARIIDVHGAVVIPGLINMHTHFSVVHPGTTDEAKLGGESAYGLALRMAACARAAVHAGVTTVRLVSEKRGADMALRDSIRAGQTEGPRIFTSGQAITSTGGHGLGSHAVEVDGVAAYRQATRDQIKQGADLIKVMISGGISDDQEGLDKLLISEDELRAAVEVAHAHGLQVAGHLGGASVIDLAVECGVDTVEHGYVLDDKVVKKMVDRGVWLVPTTLVTAGGEYFQRISAPQWLIDRLAEFAPRVRQSVALAYRSGVRILAGTDFLPSEEFDGTSAMVREIEILRTAGLSDLDALRAATSRAAECLGQERFLGHVGPGAAADLVAVREDPSKDVSALREMTMVMAQGRLIESRGTISR